MKVISYHNPFDLENSTTKELDVSNSKELIEHLKYDETAFEIAIAKNGVIMEEHFQIVHGDIVSVMVKPKGGGGGGKNILKTIAMVAVVAAAPFLFGGVAGSATLGAYTAGITSTAGLMSVYYGTMALGVMAGGMLINAVLPSQTPDLNMNLDLENIKSSPTYSWNVLGNEVQQGKPVPILYGEMRVTPPIISRYVETVNNKQYLNILYAIADGETAIDVDSIEINDEPISNFKDVQTYTRKGINDQNIIGPFDDVVSDKPVQKKISTDYVYASTTGNSVTEVTIGLVAPRGIYYITDRGGTSSYTLNVEVDILKDGVWTSLGTDQGGEKIDLGKYWVKVGSNKYGYFSDVRLAVRYQISGQGTPQDIQETLPEKTKYESRTVRLWYVGIMDYWSFVPAGFLSRVAKVTRKVWVQYEDAIDLYGYEKLTSNKQEALRYTFTASDLPKGKYEIRARFKNAPASGSRYGSDLVLEYLQEKVTDDFIYPNTALLGIRALATDQLSGSTPRVTVIARNELTNPSLIAQDILEKAGEEGLVQSVFDEFEQECDDKNYTCNIYFQETTTVRKALDKVGLTGRANIIQFGSSWSVIMDKPNKLPVQGFLINMANSETGSYADELLPIENRVNTIEVTYWDKDYGYTPQIVTVSNANYDQVDEVNKQSISYMGCTDRNMAIKYAKFLLNCSRYLTMSVSISVPTELIGCKLGDIVRLSQDVPGIGIGSGRIVSGTTEQIILDQELDLLDEIYYVEIRYNNNDTYRKLEVLENNTKTNTLTFKPLPINPETGEVDIPIVAPQQYDLYSIGTIDRISKEFQIINYTQTGDYTTKVNLLEYVSQVYDDSITINDFIAQEFQFGGLSIYENLVLVGSTIQNNVTLTWIGTSLYYDVYINNNLQTRVYETSTTIENLPAGIYNVKIVNTNGKEITQSITVLGKEAPPPKVINPSYKTTSDNFIVSWEYPEKPLDFKEFQIIRNGVVLATSSTTTVNIPIESKTLNISICAIDTSNILSAAVSLNMETNKIANINSLTATYNEAGKTILTWNRIIDNRAPIGYEIRKGNTWETAQQVAKTFETSYVIPSSGEYLIKAYYTNTNNFTQYSEIADRVIIDGANIVKNVISETEEYPTWEGQKDNVKIFNFGIFENALTLSPNSTTIDTIDYIDNIANIDYIDGSVLEGIYTSNEIITLDEPQRCSIILEYNLASYNIEDLIDNWGQIDSYGLIDGEESNVVSIEPQISIDGNAFTTFVNGDYIGETFQMRFLLKTENNNILPIVKNYKYTIDVPDKIDQETNLTVPTGGINVNFKQPFNIIPNTQITIVNAEVGDDVKMSNETKQGFTVEILNNGTQVERQINWIAQGY